MVSRVMEMLEEKKRIQGRGWRQTAGPRFGHGQLAVFMLRTEVTEDILHEVAHR